MKQRLKKGILTGMNTISINFQVMGENNVGLILQQVGAPYLALLLYTTELPVNEKSPLQGSYQGNTPSITGRPVWILANPG